MLAMTTAAKTTTPGMSLTAAQKSRLSNALANNSNTTANNNNNNNSRLKDNNRFNSDPYKSSLASSSGRDSLMQYYNNLSSYKSSQQAASSSNDITWDPLTPLAFPARQQPQLMLRRVVQVGDEMHWRKVAFGDNEDGQSLRELAKSFNEKYTGSKLLSSKKSSTSVAAAAAAGGGASRSGCKDMPVHSKITASSSASSSSSVAVSHESITPKQRRRSSLPPPATTPTRTVNKTKIKTEPIDN
ncbi:unnamed protein product [Trichobilharzia szidati]|nr:unnamed protein product [Trichobilharzia szidati]